MQLQYSPRVLDDIHWTEKSEDHIGRHGVTPGEVEEVVANAHLARHGRERTRILLGRTDAGRFLTVVLARSLRGGAYVVTARDMTFAERRLFKSRMGG